MPILDVDKSEQVIVLKRSMNTGFAGIDNPLLNNENTSLLFGDAKKSIQSVLGEVRNSARASHPAAVASRLRQLRRRAR